MHSIKYYTTSKRILLKDFLITYCKSDIKEYRTAQKIFYEKKNSKLYTTIITTYFFIFIYFWPYPWHVKVLDQRLNPLHSNELSHCSDNAESLTCCTTRNSYILFKMSIHRRKESQTNIPNITQKWLYFPPHNSTTGWCTENVQ